MSQLEIPKLSVGDRIQHELIVRRRNDKTTRDGKPYAVLELGNSSGQLSANVWSETLPTIEGVRAGHIVQVIGHVELYQDRRQIKFSAPPRIVAQSAVNLDDFLPTIVEDVGQLWDRVDEWRGEMSGQLRVAVDLFFGDDAFRVRFARTPGATRGHHALIGGLLLHSCEVAAIARASAKTMRGNVALITAGALLHDIGKTEAYSVGAGGFEYTTSGQLLGHIVLGSLMLEERVRTLPPGSLSDPQRLELHHFIQSHHGILEFGAAVRPMTLEAEILHYADQSSAKGNDFNDAVQDPDLFPNDEIEFSSKRSWRLDRRVWRRSHSWD